MTHEVYLPWVGGSFSPEFESGLLGDFVRVTAVLHTLGPRGDEKPRSVGLTVPPRLTCADLKGYLAVEGVVSTCGGLEVTVQEDGPGLEDSEGLVLVAGQVVHLRRAAAMVSVTALTTTLGGDGSDEEVFELVLPSESSGAALKEQVEQATAGMLRPLAVFVAEASSPTPFAVGDDEVVKLADEQVIIVQREARGGGAAAAVAAVPAQAATAEVGLMGRLQRLVGMKQAQKRPGAAPGRFCLRCAANVKVKGTSVSCTSEVGWAGCVVFDVPDPAYFEVTVRLAADAPHAEARGLAGRWMLGVAPAAAAEVKTERQRQRLLGLAHFVTVCHGHPAKLHAPSMPRGTCGEDCAALPGELRKGQTLTLRWAAAGGGALMAQVDEGDPVALPYAPAPFDDVRPCLVFGGRPAEVEVLQLQSGTVGGA